MRLRNTIFYTFFSKQLQIISDKKIHHVKVIQKQ